ncbi:hypothetical protein [Roseivirga echinicomitans]|uniref:Lipoprotein n=1 Tax=Roseivirga echinicomitans TaxID=296218 RepID=A0A150XYF1_9BACT|nr:hypothetical protein [Roseivirga echinicomitans]KYG83748.1 hypothetical protein AWN68_02780 [Roseivirga echinicomitans]
MKKHLFTLVIFCFIALLFHSCGSDGDDEKPTVEEYTITTYGPGIRFIDPPMPSISIEAPFSDTPSFAEIFLGFPQQFGVMNSTQAFFQSAPTEALTIDTDYPDHSFWLLNRTELQNGAVTGLNYIFIDQDGNGILETAYLLRLDATAPRDDQKTYLIGKVVKNDGTAITFAKAKELLDN